MNKDKQTSKRNVTIYDFDFDSKDKADDEASKNDDFIEADKYVPDTRSEYRIREMINERWSVMVGDLTEDEMKYFMFPERTVHGILVRCPFCGKVMACKTLLSKTCPICHRSFRVIQRNKPSRVVWVPPGKKAIYFQIYYLTFYGRLSVTGIW